MRYTWIFLALILALIELPAYAFSNEATKRNSFGSELVKQGKLEEAITEFRRAVELEPGYALAQLNLAYTYDRIGWIDEAIAAYRKATDLEPKNGTVWNNLGVLYTKKDLNDEAIQTFERGIKVDPTNTKLQANLEIAKKNRDILQEREAQIADAKKKAAARPKDPQAAYNVARISAFYGQNDQALEWLGKAIQLGYDDTQAASADPVFEELRKDPRFVRVVEKR
jgi:Flp pilus assembly protein TadD